MEESRKQRAEADLKLRRLEEEARREEACEEERKRAQAEKARMEEQRRIDEKTQQEWEKRRTSLTRTSPPSGSVENPGLGAGSSMSSLAGTNADDDSSKKRQRVSPGHQTRQHKKTKKDEADEDIEDVEEDGEDSLSAILEVTKKIDRWATNQQIKMKGLSKTQVANLGDMIARIEAWLAKAKEDRARLEGRLEERDILKVLREATIRTPNCGDSGWRLLHGRS